MVGYLSTVMAWDGPTTTMAILTAAVVKVMLRFSAGPPYEAQRCSSDRWLIVDASLRFVWANELVTSWANEKLNIDYWFNYWLFISLWKLIEQLHERIFHEFWLRWWEPMGSTFFGSLGWFTRVRGSLPPIVHQHFPVGPGVGKHCHPWSKGLWYPKQ